MISFSIALLILIVGYFIYGKFVANVFGEEHSRPTPVKTMADGVDYVELPSWKIFLIQFLNIAGLGPIFGAIMGVMFGPAAFLWIVFGTIFAGAVHDYMSGMLSLRDGGASLPEIVGSQLGGKVKNVMRGFALLLMILVGAVFVYNPADLLAMLTPDHLANPIFPMMFVSIACGAISGFHATQSPMMARCLPSEKYARPVFYGAMVTEGIVALIWAAAAITFTGGYTGLQETLGSGSPALLVNDLSKSWLGTFGGILAILGVAIRLCAAPGS